jgi:hypothetical protein
LGKTLFIANPVLYTRFQRGWVQACLRQNVSRPHVYKLLRIQALMIAK